MTYRNVGMLFLGLSALASGTIAAASDTYPVRPLRVVTTQPGSANDFLGRLLAGGMSPNLGQQVIVDNRGIVAMEIAAKARPDGYTLLLYGSTVWLSPFMREKVSWDPVKDYTPITLAVSSPLILVVHPTVPVKNVEELLALARAKPGELNYGAGTPGAGPHLAAELFKAMAKVNIVAVPYKGSGPAVTGLIGGQIQMMFPSASAALPHVHSGRLKALAVTTAKPTQLVPGVPTIASSGVPGYEAVSVLGYLGPAGLPRPIVDRLRSEIVRAMSIPEVKERLLNGGMEPVGNTPEEFAAYIKAEMNRLGKVIREAGIREQ